MLKLIKKLPVQLIISIILALIFGKVSNLFLVSVFYTVSHCLIELLLLVLPFLIFSFMFAALSKMQHGLFLVAIILFWVLVSNFISLVVAYGYGSLTLPLVLDSINTKLQFSTKVHALFAFNFPDLFSARLMLLLGVGCGVGVNLLAEHNHYKKFIKQKFLILERILNGFLVKVFMPLLPVYVFGFCARLSFDNMLQYLFSQYGRVFILSMFLVSTYMFFWYWVSSGKLKTALKNLQFMIPAGLTGFSTMSSAATMPVTIIATQKMLQNKEEADLIIPATVNIHMLGDNLTMIITAIALLILFGQNLPNATEFMLFIFSFALIKLSCVGAPGASVFVVLPVVKEHLGMSAEMLSIFTTIYVLQDPFGTAANVLGNGGLALMIQKTFKKLNRLRHK